MLSFNARQCATPHSLVTYAPPAETSVSAIADDRRQAARPTGHDPQNELRTSSPAAARSRRTSGGPAIPWPACVQTDERGPTSRRTPVQSSAQRPPAQVARPPPSLERESRCESQAAGA